MDTMEKNVYLKKKSNKKRRRRRRKWKQINQIKLKLLINKKCKNGCFLFHKYVSFALV